MGCQEANKPDRFPTLMMYFDLQSEAQKQYCLNLKENFHHFRTVKFLINGCPNEKFRILFKKDNKIYTLQDTFINSEQAMNATLNKAYEILK